MDLSVIYYRLALSKQELAQTETRLENAREQLRTEEQQLSDYKEILKELKGGAR
jgi:chromosome condensin MukBEF ATPase and DNA-binding subunit MukB